MYPLPCHVESTCLPLLSLDLLRKNITIDALLTQIFFYWHPLSSFFLLSFCCFLYPHFYILDIFITVSCLWFLSIPLWSDNDLLTQTRTIAVSLVKSAGSDPQDQYKLVKDISFWNPPRSQSPSSSHVLNGKNVALSCCTGLQEPFVAALRHSMGTGLPRRTPQPCASTAWRARFSNGFIFLATFWWKLETFGFRLCWHR